MPNCLFSPCSFSPLTPAPKKLLANSISSLKSIAEKGVKSALGSSLNVRPACSRPKSFSFTPLVFTLGQSK